MADKIKIRRGLFADLPDLDEGELGLVKDRGTVYVGTNSDHNILLNPVLVADDGYTLDGYLYPATDNVHGLGTPDKRWQSVSVGPGSIHITSKETDPGYTENKEYRIGIDQSTGILQISSKGTILMELDPTSGASFPAGGGSAMQVDIFTADGTWNKPDDAKIVVVWGIGGGGGGGGGRQGLTASNKFGGNGGGGAGARQETFIADNLPISVSVTVGQGGTGGTGATTTDTNGINGNDGTSSIFGSFQSFGGGGGGGLGGTASANIQGGGSGSSINSASGITGGLPNVTTNGVSIEGITGALDTTARTGTWGGGAGGGTGNTGFAHPGRGSIYGGAGGGAGGGISSGNIIVVNGAVGGTTPTFNTVTAATGGGTGDNGADGSDASVHQAQQGGYGGTGGDGSSSSIGGNGGNGGIPGGGAGGGGASVNGNNAGDGGDGGRGEVRVYTYF